MAISRSKVVFLFDFPLLYIYSFYLLVCKALQETSAMLLEIPQSGQAQVLSLFAQWPIWCMTSAPARALVFTGGEDL